MGLNKTVNTLFLHILVLSFSGCCHSMRKFCSWSIVHKAFVENIIKIWFRSPWQICRKFINSDVDRTKFYLDLGCSCVYNTKVKYNNTLIKPKIIP